MQGIIFIISSPSGGGKGTLIHEVLRSVPNIGYSVSFTTRKMREGEANGKDYFFVSRTEFEKRIADGEFLEYADVHGNFYGTSKMQVLREVGEGRDIILEIDVQGAENVRNILEDSVGVFILPPSFEILRKRLTLRKTETAQDLSLRLLNAAGEVEKYGDFDYVIVNDELEKAVCELKSVIYAERVRRERQIESVKKILDTFENFTKSSRDN